MPRTAGCNRIAATLQERSDAERRRLLEAGAVVMVPWPGDRDAVDRDEEDRDAAAPAVDHRKAGTGGPHRSPAATGPARNMPA